MWLEAGLSWKDFLPEDEDVNKFVTEKVLKAVKGVLFCIDLSSPFEFAVF